MARNHTIQYRVSRRGGWIGLFTGESMGKALERELDSINEAGHRVRFIFPDKWSFAKHLQNILVTIVTLGIVSYTQDVLIVAETDGEIEDHLRTMRLSLETLLARGT